MRGSRPFERGHVEQVSFGMLELASKELGIVMDPTAVEVRYTHRAGFSKAQVESAEGA